MKHNIKRIPLLFLFSPIIIAAIVLILLLDNQHRQLMSTHLQNNAKHMIEHIGEISRQPLYHRQYGQLKQTLWDFADKSDFVIENVVLYNKDGEFVVALNLNEQVMNSTIADFPERQYFEQDGIYYAFGVISQSDQQVALNDNADVLGHIRIEFVAHSLSLMSSSVIGTLLVVIISCLILSMFLWRHRYGEFHRQMGDISRYIQNQNKGYKQGKLTADSFYYEINQLQEQVMSLVGFYEKRLTMKQFEVGALEQSLRESQAQIEEQKELSHKELQQQQESVQMAKASALFTSMYQVVFQRLQARFAIIEHAIVDYYNTNRFAQQSEDPAQWQEQEHLVGASNQLNQLLCEIKRLADSASGALRQPVEYISLSQLITSISHFVIPVANQKSLEFVVVQPDHPIDIEVDVNQLQQVMIALMQSAVANSNSGYIKLTVDVLPLDKGNTELQQLCCKVQDSGAGLTDMQVAMLANDEIDPKLADDNWIDEGLRLMVAKTIVKSMGGEFKVRSLSGLGAEIIFGLKCKASHSSAQDLSSYNGCDILIYDPVVESGTVIYDKLSEHGMLAVHCKRLDEIQAVLSKGTLQCMICCRPVEEQAQQLFDQNMMALISEHQIEHCLLISAKPGLPFELPSSWLLAEKPFVLTSLLDYYHPYQSTPADKINPVEVTEQDSHQRQLANLLLALESSKQMQILAVDDNETNLKLLSVILKEYPVNLVQSLSGREALVLAQQQGFDLILMDKEMPNMSGVETSLAIRKIELNRTTPIVMFSAHVDDHERREMLGLDINDVIEKPLDEQKFYRLMENFCIDRWQKINGQP